MKLEGKVRVKMMPVHAAFPYPTIPAFSYTDFCYEFGPANSDGSSIETNSEVEAIYPRPVFVPHNNFALGRTDPTPPVHNTSLPTWNWSEDVAPAGTLTFMGQIWLTPWIKSTWTDEPAKALFYGHVTSPAGSANVRHDYIPANNTISIRCGAGVSGDVSDMQGFYLQLGAEMDSRTETWTSTSGVWSHAYSFAAPSDPQPYVLLSIGLGNQGSSTPTKWIVIVRSMTGAVVIYESTSAYATTKKLREILPDAKPGDISGSRSFAYHGYGDGYTNGEGFGKTIHAKFINGCLSITGLGTAEAVSLNNLTLGSDSKPVNTIKQVAVKALGIRGLFVGFAPMKFMKTARFTSGLINTGTNPSTVTSVIHYGFNEYKVGVGGRVNSLIGPTATATTTIVATQVSYILDFISTLTGTYNNVQYADLVQTVKAVTINIKEHVIDPIGNTVYLYPESAVVDQIFDINQLTIVGSAVLVFNSFKSLDALYGTQPFYWGEFSQNSGHVAIQIDMAVDYYDPSLGENSSPYDTTGWVTVFTGYGNTVSDTIKGEGGAADKYIMHCSDRMIAMKNPKYALPWMDGWNVYYMAAFVANVSGVKKGTSSADSDMVFYDKIPSDPYQDSPGGGSYFLPVGTGGHPLVRFQGGEAPWNVYGRTLAPYGYLRYFNAQGKFDVKPFKLSNATQPYRIFGLVDTLGGGTNPNINSVIFQNTVHRDLSEVRNSIILLGIAAYNGNWDYIAYQAQDLNSIYGGNDADPFFLNGGNYVGFKQEFVWKDSQFATQQYIADAALGTFNILKYPSITCITKTWLQPDIFPEMRIGVYDVKSGLYDRNAGAFLELMVMRVKHVVRKGEVPITTLGTRFVPPGLGVN
jgi:hypothetical protein